MRLVVIRAASAPIPSARGPAHERLRIRAGESSGLRPRGRRRARQRREFHAHDAPLPRLPTRRRRGRVAESPRALSAVRLSTHDDERARRVLQRRAPLPEIRAETRMTRRQWRGVFLIVLALAAYAVWALFFA